jgi:hypothetical protein
LSGRFGGQFPKPSCSRRGIAPVNVRWREPVPGQLAKLEGETDGRAQAIRFMGGRIQFVGCERAVPFVRDEGLGGQLFAPALLAGLFQPGGAQLAEVGGGGSGRHPACR